MPDFAAADGFNRNQGRQRVFYDVRWVNPYQSIVGGEPQSPIGGFNRGGHSEVHLCPARQSVQKVESLINHGVIWVRNYLPDLFRKNADDSPHFIQPQTTIGSFDNSRNSAKRLGAFSFD